MPTNQLILTIRESYGRVRAYPANDTATLFALLLETKTFTTHQLDLIKRLGYTVELKHPDLKAIG